MLTILNGKERNQAFQQFLVFFLLTVALIVGAIYFNFRVPIQLNEFLRKDNTELRDQYRHQQIFVAKMNEINILIDSLDKSGKNLAWVETQITNKIEELNKLKITENSAYEMMNSSIINSFLEFMSTRKRLAELKIKADMAQEMDKKLKDCELSLDAYRRPRIQLNVDR